MLCRSSDEKTTFAMMEVVVVEEKGLQMEKACECDCPSTHWALDRKYRYLGPAPLRTYVLHLLEISQFEMRCTGPTVQAPRSKHKRESGRIEG